MKLDAILHRHRSTKIVATLGPSSKDADMIRQLFLAGVDVFRMNFSHGTHADHQIRYDMIRALEREIGRPIGILMDLQGPKLRLGQISGGKMNLEIGQKLRLDMNPAIGTHERVPLLHPEIFAAVKAGEDLLIDDGKVRLRILSCDGESAEVEALNAGVISDRKGVNVPGAILPLSPLTAKDRQDLEFGLSLGMDWIALSFVQRPGICLNSRILWAIEQPSWLNSKSLLQLIRLKRLWLRPTGSWWLVVM